MKKEFINELLSWYDKSKRNLPWRKNKNAYQIWVSEIMLQQTRVEAVIPYFERFTKAIPNLKELSTIPEDKLLKLWEGLGYYSRVRNMQKCAKELIQNNKEELPKTYDALLKCPGIGPYTAGAIASIVYNEKVCAVDGNVLRVYSRVTASTENISQIKVRKEIEQNLNKIMPKESGNFNQALMELGATICIPGNPRCNICPIQKFCSGYKKGIMGKLPIKDSKKDKKDKNMIVFLLLWDYKVAIQKRPNHGLLASLFEFPNMEKKIEYKQVKEMYPSEIIQKGNSYKHIFTHQIWNMESFVVSFKEKPLKEYTWVSLEELLSTYSIPSAFQYFIKDIEDIVKRAKI